MAESETGLEPTTPLDIRDGVIHYHLYSQDGRLIPMTCKDTKDMRQFVVWIKQHDRY